MALEGNLRDFNILEVIQLLGQQGKSGVLRVWRSRGEDAEIFFYGGRITHATPVQRQKEDLLGERLVKAGIVARKDFESALRTQQDSARYLGEILVEGGMADEQAVLNVLYTQIHEIIYDVFRWGEGKFKFDVLTVKRLPKISVKLNAEEVMLNILRMVDEWPEIARRVPPPSMVLQQTGTLEEDGIGLPEGHDAIYRLVDGKRQVRDIADISVLGEFTTFEILADLLESGYVQTVRVKRPHVPPDVGLVGEKLRQRPARFAYGLGVMVIFVFIVLSFFHSNVDFLWRDLGGPGYFPTGYIEKIRDDRIERGRKLFFLETGRYSQDLRELVVAGILSQDDLKVNDGR